MDSSNNNTGYVDYIMDYAKVLVPFTPPECHLILQLIQK